MLKSYSAVFRGAFTSNTTSSLITSGLPTTSDSRISVTLSDEKFENATTVRVVIGIIDGSHHIKPDTEIAILDGLLHFADKWDCAPLREQVVNALFMICHTCRLDGYYYRNMGELFVLAARWGLPNVAVAVITSTGRWTWDEKDKEELEGGAISGRWVLDPLGWPAYLIQNTPPLYSWALARVARDYTDVDVGPDADVLEGMGSAFLDLIAMGQRGMFMERSS